MNATSKKLLAPAWSLTLLAVAFRFDAHGIAWFWAAQPQVAAALAAGAAVCWLLVLASLRQRRD